MVEIELTLLKCMLTGECCNSGWIKELIHFKRTKVQKQLTSTCYQRIVQFLWHIIWVIYQQGENLEMLTLQGKVDNMDHVKMTSRWIDQVTEKIHRTLEH